jgi:hypothetical protein
MARRTGTRRQTAIARHLRGLAPMMPLADFNAALEVALAGHLRHLPPTVAAILGLSARLRHAHTEYDAMLAEGYDPDSARHFVAAAMNDMLARWGGAPMEFGE